MTLDPAGPSSLRRSVRERRSIRKYLDKPVPTETISSILSDALWAPSWANTQPWEIIVVTGRKLQEFKKDNRKSLLDGGTSAPDIPMPIDWPEAMKRRRVDLSRAIYDSLGIDRDDADARLAYYADMYGLFDAPALVLFLIDDKLSTEYAMLDLGAYLQTFFLLIHEQGLGACAFAGTVHSPAIVHRHFSIPQSKRLAIGVALGWPDPDAPINTFPRTRDEIGSFVTWIR